MSAAGLCISTGTMVIIISFIGCIGLWIQSKCLIIAVSYELFKKLCLHFLKFEVNKIKLYLVFLFCMFIIICAINYWCFSIFLSRCC